MNYGIASIMMCIYGLIKYSKYNTLVGVVDSVCGGEGCVCAGAQDIWEFCNFWSIFLWTLKCPKNRVHTKDFKEEQPLGFLTSGEKSGQMLPTASGDQSRI